jgi:hypothetical protein
MGMVRNVPTTTAIEPMPSHPYIVHDRLPVGCFAFEVTHGTCEPSIHDGEFVVIDPVDRKAVIGQLYLCRFSASVKIVEVIASPSRGSSRVLLTAHSRPGSHAEIMDWIGAGRTKVFADGPYDTEGPNAGYLESLIIGRVTGVLSVEAAAPFAPIAVSRKDRLAVLAL